MGEKDITEKLLADYNDVFADIVNVLLFNGERLVKEEELKNTKDKSQYKADGGIHEQERDLSKIWQNCNLKISMIGMENQTDIDEYMPLRIIGYDGAAYRSQYEATKTVAYPVVTIILHFGNRKWEKPKCLSDIMSVPEVMQPYFQDYGINVFNIPYLSDEQVGMFQSDFKIVADYFVQMRSDPEHYKPSQQTITHVDAILKLMSVLTGDSRYEEAVNSLKGKKGGVTMCNAMESAELKGRAKGRAEGRAEGRIDAIQRLIKKEQTKEFIMELGYSEEEYQQAEKALLSTV